LKIAALAALLLASPAFAQDRAAEIDFENALQASQAAARDAQSRATIEKTLVAMNDGPEAGGAVVSFLREKGITVVLRTQTEASKFVVEADGKKIALSDALPAYPRVFGPLIAKEAAAQMYADMPACAERSYMRRGVAGRVWLELGGRVKDLPIVEPLTAELVSAVSGEIGLWADKDGAEWALERIGAAEKLAPIPALEQGASKELAAKLEVANKRFVAFLLDERQARKDAGLK
jgi:hypothetical protein